MENKYPRYTFTKRQIKGVKGWEINYHINDGWPESLGFFKTMKEARFFAEIDKMFRSKRKNQPTNDVFSKQNKD